MNKNKTITILMAEDNATDVMLTKEALAHAKLLNTLHVVEDGMEALDFLHRRGKLEDVFIKLTGKELRDR